MGKNTSIDNSSQSSINNEPVLDSTDTQYDKGDKQTFEAMFNASLKIIANYFNKAISLNSAPSLNEALSSYEVPSSTLDKTLNSALVAGVNSVDLEDPLSLKPLVDIFFSVADKVTGKPVSVLKDVWYFENDVRDFYSFDSGPEYDSSDYLKELNLAQDMLNSGVSLFFGSVSAYATLSGFPIISAAVSTGGTVVDAYKPHFEEPKTQEEWEELLLETWDIFDEEKASKAWASISDKPVTDAIKENEKRQIQEIEKTKLADQQTTYEINGIEYGSFGYEVDYAQQMQGESGFSVIGDFFSSLFSGGGDSQDPSPAPGPAPEDNPEAYSFYLDALERASTNSIGKTNRSKFLEFVNNVFRPLYRSTNRTTPEDFDAPASEGPYGDWLNSQSKAFGFSYVPYNNFPAMLHEGERVLTASENRAYNSNSGAVVISGNNFTIREEADIEKVAKAIVRKMSRAYAVTA